MTKNHPATNGPKAAVGKDGGPPPILVADCEMPFFSGPEVLRDLLGRGRRVPALLLSAGDDVFFPGEFPDVVFLAEPFGLTEFRAAVLGALKEGPTSWPRGTSGGGGRS